MEISSRREADARGGIRGTRSTRSAPSRRESSREARSLVRISTHERRRVQGRVVRRGRARGFIHAGPPSAGPAPAHRRGTRSSAHRRAQTHRTRTPQRRRQDGSVFWMGGIRHRELDSSPPRCGRAYERDRRGPRSASTQGAQSEQRLILTLPTAPSRTTEEFAFKHTSARGAPQAPGEGPGPAVPQGDIAD